MTGQIEAQTSSGDIQVAFTARFPYMQAGGDTLPAFDGDMDLAVLEIPARRQGDDFVNRIVVRPLVEPIPRLTFDDLSVRIKTYSIVGQIKKDCLFPW